MFSRISQRSAIPPSRSARHHAILTAAVFAAISSSAPAQRQFDELPKRGLPADTERTSATAVVDVDGDGDLDLVVGNFGTQNQLYLNDGRGVYVDATAATMPADTDITVDITVGDVDGDGDADLAMGNREGQNRLYLNTGNGVFVDATSTNLPALIDRTYEVGFGDVDGDGDLDLVCGNYGSGIPPGGLNRLHLNNGNGVFTDATASWLPVVSAATQGLALGDVDGDGDLDLVTGNYSAGSGQQNRLYLNSQQIGAFVDATALGLPLANESTTSVALGDVDGDGDLDLVCGNTSDFLGLTAASQDRLYLNNGSGVFSDVTSTQMPVLRNRTTAVRLEDFDGDGDLDLVTGGEGQNQAYRNDGSGTFRSVTTTSLPAVGQQTEALATGDIDGDGDVDLVEGNWGRNRLYLNDSNGVFTDATASRQPQRGAAWAVASGDVDGDGDPDLVWAGRQRQNLLYRNDGAGSFTDVTGAQMPADSDDTRSVVLGDVDGDGDLDLLCANGSPLSIDRLYMNDGRGSFTDETAARLPTALLGGSVVLALGDVDGDGDPDLISARYGQSIGLFLNSGNGFFSVAPAASMPLDSDNTEALALGDVDGDGDLDLVCGNGADYLNYYGQQNRLYLNAGNGTFSDATATHLPAGTYGTASVALGDVDGDGDLDLVTGDGGSYYSIYYGQPQQNRLYLNSGSGTFAEATATHMPTRLGATKAVQLGDVDGDGDLDLYAGNWGDNSGPFGYSPEGNSLYLNDGSGTFRDTSDRLPPDFDFTRGAALADVDADGDLDVLVANDDGTRVYFNLRRHLDAPQLPRVGQPYVLDAYARYGPAVPANIALPYLSLTRVSIPLPPYGVVGIDPMVPLPPLVIPAATGVARASWTLPNQPWILGVPIHAQAVMLSYPLQERLSNVTTDEIIR